MGYNKQLNDSYRIVYTDTGSTALPDIHTFDHTGVYSLIAKPSQLGKTVTIGFSCVSGGKTTNTTLAEGNYFVEYSELAANIYWNFSFLGKANSGADFTAQNTTVTYDKSKGTYTVKSDELSGGGDVPTPGVYVKKTIDVTLTASDATTGTNTNLTGYVLSNNKIVIIGSITNKATTKNTYGHFSASYSYDKEVFTPSNIFFGYNQPNTNVKGHYIVNYSFSYKIGTTTYGSNTIMFDYVPATSSETKTNNYTADILIYGAYNGT